MKRLISLCLSVVILLGTSAVTAVAAEAPGYRVYLEDGTELTMENRRLLVPEGVDTIQIKTAGEAAVTDTSSGEVLTPDNGDGNCYTLRQKDHYMYGDGLSIREKASQMAIRRKEARGEKPEQLKYLTGTYSGVEIELLDSGESENLSVSWQLELPAVTEIAIDGGIRYTPIDDTESTQKFVLEKGADEAVIHIQVSDNTSAAELQDEDGNPLHGQLKREAEGYSFTMTDSEMRRQEDGTTLTRVLVLENSEGQQARITFVGACRHLDGPDAIVDYLCLGSQYSSGGNQLTGVYGLYPEKALIGLGYWWSPISIGNFGGYITYYYEEPIRNDPKNPYGIDFVVYGNSNGGSGFSEPGNVLVSEDGETWYTLAGSEHYEDRTDWNGTVTYERMDNGGTRANGTALDPYLYPSEEHYPLHDWQAGEESRITVSGVMLDNIFPAFGYADVHTNSKSAWGTGTNVTIVPEARNPYWPVTTQANGLNAPENQDEIYEGGGDGFDLAWAVDGNGLPVELEEIHYIKIQSSMLSLNVGGIGEKSPEVNAVSRVMPAAKEVGASTAPKKITVGGQTIALKDGVYEYTVDQAISGPFTVEVEAGEGTNVYIGSLRGESRTYVLCPQKQLIRIIVQDGEKEPLQYFIHVTPAPLTSVYINSAVDQVMREAGAAAEEPFTRTMACAALYAISGEPAYEEPYFLYVQEIDKDAWYKDACYWAVESGLIRGCAENYRELKLDSGVTRAQWAVLMERYAAIFGIHAGQNGAPACHDKDEVPSWAVDAVAWAIENRIMTTDSSGNWNPLGGVTQSEIESSIQALSGLLA